MAEASNILLGGIEGGATHSRLYIFSGDGRELAYIKGPGTNHWLVGYEECAKRVTQMVAEGKKIANIDENKKLTVLGLSLSGCEEEESNKTLKETVRKFDPHIAETILVYSDTAGSVATAAEKGGIVIISGTGSNTLLRNPDGTQHGCGGWGNFLGDEASGFWITHQAIKTYFDDEDNFVKSPFPTDYVWKKIKEHFKISTRNQLLTHCYQNFNKSYYAAMCSKLAEGCKDEDPLCVYIFEKAGYLLAKTIIALLPKIDPILYEQAPLKIICVGSVWLSWDYLKPGFLKVLEEEKINFDMEFVRLTTSTALGTVYLAADHIQHKFVRNYEENYNAFYKYERKNKHEKCLLNGKI